MQEELLRYAEAENAAFQARLTPTLAPDLFLGVRVPRLREIEKRYRGSEEASCFLKQLPHQYFDENMLHSVFLSNLKTYEETIDALETFLPYVDNWAVCDTIRPKMFRKAAVKEELLLQIHTWILSRRTYTCRFGILMLMSYYLDAWFRAELLSWPAEVRSEEYYVNMMIAWFFATALAKQWDSAVIYLEERRLPQWVHQKTIQKACESNRISAEQKIYLKGLK